MTRGVAYWDHRNPETQSKILLDYTAYIWLCTNGSKWRQLDPDRLVNRSSLQWCQEHTEAMTMTANPAGKRKSNQCDWGRMKRTKGQGGNDPVESRKKKKKKLYSWGVCAWGTRWQQQPCGTGWQLQGSRGRQEAVERELGIKGYSFNKRRAEKTENEDTTEEGATGGVPVKKNL